MPVASAMRITKIEKRYSIIGELQDVAKFVEDVLWALLTGQSIVARSTFALSATFTR